MKAVPGRVDLIVPAGTKTAGSGHQCALYVGTCGYSYTEWVDSGFYPVNTKNSAMLGLYSRGF